MPTQCISEQLCFEGFDGRRVVAAFGGGAVLLRETDRPGRRVLAGRVVHSLGTLIGQRIIGPALGYEDVNDHDKLRFDPVLTLFSDRLEARRRDGAALGGKSTLNRLEHAPRDGDDRYRRIAVDRSAVENLFVDLFLEAHAKAPKEIVLDLDATDDPLRPSGRPPRRQVQAVNIDASAGAVDEVARIIARIRERWPRVRILLRADSGFAREALMAWRETHRVDYVSPATAG